MDVKVQVTGHWSDLLRELERDYGLDVDNENHIWLTHVLFLPMLNRDLASFQSAWNSHTLRISGQ